MAERSTEFGGVSGRIAPLPHALTAAEAARLERNTNPNDEGATVEKQRVVDAGRRGIGPVKPNGDL